MQTLWPTTGAHVGGAIQIVGGHAGNTVVRAHTLGAASRTRRAAPVNVEIILNSAVGALSGSGAFDAIVRTLRLSTGESEDE